MVTIREWNVLEYLDSEEEIAGYLEAVLEEGGTALFLSALPEAAQARFINQLAKETGIDRKSLCGVFLDGGNAAPSDPAFVEKLARAFSIAVPV